MSYTPYSPYSQLTTNSFIIQEGFDFDKIINDMSANIATIATDIPRLTDNQNDISNNLIVAHNTLQNNPDYRDKANRGILPSNGKQRPTAVDEMVRDSALLKDANNQMYMFGIIAVTSLGILFMYI